jgi:hypothetical protein
VSVANKELHADFGYLSSSPRDPVFRRELEDEIDRFRSFLSL